jgi:formyltetrahydrofolate-dependent phosphoribosylglycinamide formyltransferase
MTPCRVAVLASGGGSNLGALFDHFDALGAATPAHVALVASNQPSAGALARAAARRVPTAVIDTPGDADALLAVLRAHDTDLVVLAGYLKLVPAAVTDAFAGRIVNVHPALLPRHGGHGMYGARVHRAVLAAGDTESGATVHLVDAAYDRGAAIVQAHVPVVPGDTADTLAARVLRSEHFVLPRAVAALAAGEITVAGGRATVGAAARARFDAPPAGVRVSFPG